MTQPPPSTDTPAPADGAGEEGLNDEIAMALGWTRIRKHQKLSSGVITTSFRGTDPQGITGAVVPRYDRDPSAALGLLAYVVGSTKAFCTYIGRFKHEGEFGQFHIGLKLQNGYPLLGQADTLENAIAQACRDALVALKETEGVGK